jgi:hypothetical protein
MSASKIDPRLLKLIENIFKDIFLLSLAYMVGIIIYLGIKYITSSGNKLEEIHKKWPLFLIGAVLVILSFTIPKLIGLFFEVQINLTQ